MVAAAMTIAVPDRTGAARMVVNYGRALRQRGHDVVVIHGPPPVDSRGRIQSIVPDLAALGIATSTVPRLRRPLPMLIDRDLTRAARGVDVIIGFNQRDRAAATRAGALLGVPVILSVQNRHAFWGPPPLPMLKRRFYERAVSRGADLAICTSQAVEREMLAMGLGSHRCVVLPNGIELQPLPAGTRRTATRRSLGVGDDTRLFATVGRLDAQKGHDLLIRAWARAGAAARDARLLIIGGTSEGAQATTSKRYRDRLVEQIHDLELGTSVDLLGWRNDVPDLLAAADVYVHPARWEGWPLAVLEAMAASLPTIMTDCAGAPETHDPSLHGPVLPTGDVAALAGALRDFLDRPTADLQRMGRRCRELVEEQYDLDTIGSRFADLVESVATGSRDVSPRVA